MSRCFWSAAAFTVFLVLSACSPQPTAVDTNHPWSERDHGPNGWANERTEIAPPDGVVLGTLANGFRYYIESSDAPGAALSLRLTISAGAMHDSPGDAGTAHVVSHLLAKGASRDGSPAIRVHPRSDTVSLASIFALDLPDASPDAIREALDQLVALATTPAGGRELAAARSEIQQEYEEKPDGFSLPVLAFGSAVFGDHPVMRSGADAQATSAVTLEAVREFQSRYYVPNRAVLVVVGNIDSTVMKSEIEKRFGRWLAPDKPAPDPAPLDGMPPGPDLVMIPGGGSQLALSLMNTTPFREAYIQRADLRTQFVEDAAMAAACIRICGIEPGSLARPLKFFVGPAKSAVSGVRQGFAIGGSATADDLTPVARAMIAAWRSAASGVSQMELDGAIAKMREEAKQGSGKIRIAVRTDLLATEIAGKVIGDPLFLPPGVRRQLIEEFAPTVSLNEVNNMLKDRLGPKPRMIVTGGLASEAGLREAIAEEWGSSR